MTNTSTRDTSDLGGGTKFNNDNFILFFAVSFKFAVVE